MTWNRADCASTWWSLQIEQPRGLHRIWEYAVLAPLGGRADHPAKWVLLKDDDRAKRFIIRHGPLFQDNKGVSEAGHMNVDLVCNRNECAF